MAFFKWQNCDTKFNFSDLFTVVRVVFRQFGRLEHTESMKRTLLYVGVNEAIKLDIFGINAIFHDFCQTSLGPIKLIYNKVKSL